MNHYVYYSFEEWGSGYIGVRSCDCDPQSDPYFGSYKCTKFAPTEKVIIATFDTRAEAVEAEIALHNFYEVGVNKHFANQVKQTSVAYDTTGKVEKPAAKAKRAAAISAAKKGRSNGHEGMKHSPETVEKMRNAQKGVRKSDATRAKMSQTRKGRPVSDEQKLKLKAAAIADWAKRRQS